MSPSTKKKEAPKAAPYKIHNAPDFKSMYVNWAQTSASPTDIVVGIGEASPTQEGVIDVEVKTRLVLAPLQAKIMVMMLVQVIQQYEKQFGKIIIPSALGDQLKPLMEGVKAAVAGNTEKTEGD